MLATGSRVVPLVVKTVVLWSLFGALTSLAQQQVAQTAPEAVSEAPPGDLWEARFRYGLSVRAGSEKDSGPGLSYSGFTPNDFAVNGWVWPLLNRHLGLAVGFQREAFGLYEGATRVTSGGLIRASAGPGGRVTFGPVSLDAVVSYTFQQLPVFGTVTTPTFSALTRHAVLLAARGVVDLGPLTLEARFEYPIALATVGPDVTTSGFGVGGGVRVRVVQAGALDFGVMGDVTWHKDSITQRAGAAPLESSLSVIRAALGVDVRWKEQKTALPATPEFGSVLVQVTVDGAAAEHAFRLELADGVRDLKTAASGSLQVPGLRPGPVTARAEQPGFVAAQATGSVLAGGELVLALALVKEAPKVGALKVRVVSKDGNKALAGAKVLINGETRDSSAVGEVEVGELPAGPVSVKVTLADFAPGDEAVSIIAGTTTDLTVTLVPSKRRVPATVSGLVRSARGGAPVAAKLEIKELKKSIVADAKGAFALEVPGGKYTVKISAEGFIAQTKTVTVRDGDQAIFNVDLFPK